MKILELIAIPTHTGAGAPMLNLSRHLKNAGHDLHIYIDQYRPHNLHEILAAEDLEPCLGLMMSGIAPPHKNIADIRKLAGIIGQGAFDFILCHLSHDHVLATVARAFSKSKPPIVRFLHSARSLSDRPMQKLLWDRTDGVITHSRALADVLLDKFSFNQTCVLHLPPEVDLRRFRPPSSEERLRCRETFGFEKNDFVVGYVARIKPGRRHADLMRAFAECRENLVRMHLMIVGDGEILSETRRLVESLDIGGRVVFTGYLDAKLSQAYMAMDAYIQMAVGNDASCRAVLEALACGLPVRAASDAAPLEYFEHAKASSLFHFDAKGIKTALEELYLLPRAYNATDFSNENGYGGEKSRNILDAFFVALLKSAKSST